MKKFSEVKQQEKQVLQLTVNICCDLKIYSCFGISFALFTRFIIFNEYMRKFHNCMYISVYSNSICVTFFSISESDEKCYIDNILC